MALFDIHAFSTGVLPTVVSDKTCRVFSRFGATRAMTLDISKAFDMLHGGFLQKLLSYGFPGRVFALIFGLLSVIDNFEWFWMGSLC